MEIVLLNREVSLLIVDPYSPFPAPWNKAGFFFFFFFRLVLSKVHG